MIEHSSSSTGNCKPPLPALAIFTESYSPQQPGAWNWPSQKGKGGSSCLLSFSGISAYLSVSCNQRARIPLDFLVGDGFLGREQYFFFS